MIIDSALGLRTNTRLAGALSQAKSRVVSSEDLMEQRVSFVFGSVAPNSNVTRERVREVILHQVGSIEEK